MENTPSQIPQNPQPEQPQQQIPQPTPLQPSPMAAPIAPIDKSKTSKAGWITFAVGVLITVAGFMFDFISAISIFAFAFSARLGLQAKNKRLSIASFVLMGLVVALFIAAVILS